ncbi:ATP-binding protein [Belliella sp. R4-6]|uniref:ATP-binding protein n=1 Tax=Belliella alkalica TaxID=1730871 RepID=A0ABS9VGZ1_9BACT|nr:ATP-binding protein [Belliella alkalica]MCH7415717.1 ATP-binding protein [Belliella alkalica]
MLIRFTIENFLSFREKQVFSMIPGKGSLKSHHKSTSAKGVSALKAGVIFGANASGKSNLIKAIDFGRKTVLNGTKPEQLISTNFYKLDKKFFNEPTYVEYEIQHKGKNYAYGFILNSKEIIDEWLFEIIKSGETKIFERKNTTEYDLGFLFKKNKTSEEKQFLEFTAKGTPRNQLLITQIRNTNVIDNVSDIQDILNVIDWFQNALTVIYSGTKNISKKFELHKDTNLQQVFKDMLEYFDTGIDGIEFKEVDFEKMDILTEVKEDIKSDLLSEKSEKTSAFLSNPQDDKYYVISKIDNLTVQAKLLKTKHKIVGGGYELFDLKDESDGTRRIMDLIPLIIDFFRGGNVFVVDEIERSLHPNLVRDFFEFILDKCENINSQLIVSSHEATLLTQKLLRKDEIWFAVKNKEGATKLHSLEDYNVRFDKEIMKDYLLGRFKGVPKLGNRNQLSILPINE